MTHSGGKPHEVGDKGQRYEVSYYDPSTSTRKKFGWTNDFITAAGMLRSISLHPTMQLGMIHDRQPK